MRTFLAIDISLTPALKEFCHHLELHLKGVDIKFTSHLQYHITLLFLGETGLVQIENICNAFTNVQLGCNQIELELNSIGVFKNTRNAQVLWVGIKPNNKLQKLYVLVNDLTTKQGFNAEHKTFSPHLTIGRIKRVLPDNNLDWFIKEYEGNDFGKMWVSRLVFYQSILKSDGAHYIPLQYFDFR